MPFSTRSSGHPKLKANRWKVFAKDFLSEPANVWCRKCRKSNLLVPAREVDHIIPHRGNEELIWDRKNMQGLCRPCHSRKTLRENMRERGYQSKPKPTRGGDIHGMPLDPNHPWNQGKRR
jgi:5-methylcytosine-specific restriction endonuclease McrA